MKKSIKNILLGGTIVGCLLSGCTPFDELNADPTRLNEANPGSFLDPILYNISIFGWKRFNDYTYELMGNVIDYRGTNGLGWCMSPTVKEIIRGVPTINGWQMLKPWEKRL